MTAAASGPMAAASAVDWSPAATLVLVVNARSGRNESSEALAAIGAEFAAAGRHHEVHRVEDPARLAPVAAEAAKRAKALGGALVAFGGDGTLNAVAQAALGQGVVFGAIPGGTFNYFGRAHGLAQDPVLAARTLLRARPRPVQAGRVNGRIFLVNASLGLYPRLLEDREAFKRQYGRSRFVAVLAGLWTLWRSPPQLRLQIRRGQVTRTLRTPTLFIGNNVLQLQQVGVAEAEAVARPEPGLAAVVLRPVGSLRLLFLALLGALGRLGEAGQVESFAFERLEVRVLGRRRVKVATDGEVTRMRTPLCFEVAPEPLWLLQPAPADATEVA